MNTYIHTHMHTFKIFIQKQNTPLLTFTHPKIKKFIPTPIHTHAYIHIHKCAYTYIYTPIYKYTIHIYRNKQRYIHTRIYKYTHTYIYIQTKLIRTYINNQYMYINIHKDTYTYIHTYVHILIHTYTQT